jgi:hypothetical protein
MRIKGAIRVPRVSDLRYVVALLLVLVAGCQAVKPGKPLPPELAGNDPGQQLEFWHTLTTQPITTNDEAFHGLLLYVDGKDNAADYAGRVHILKQRKMLQAGFNEPATAPATRGTLSVGIVRVLKVKGGLTMHLVGDIPRYAVRELQFIGVYPVSSPNQVFSGNEYVGIIGKLEDYQRGDVVETPNAAMSEEARPATSR